MFTCSFCNKTEEEVNQLFVGPRVTICNECVSLCNHLMLEEKYIRIFNEKVDEIRSFVFKEFWGGA